MAFPISPTNNQTTVLNGIIYIYNSTNNSWKKVANTVTDITARNTGNDAFSAANTADSKAVSAGSYANSAFGTANSSALYANAAFLQANSAYGSQNTTGSYANSAYTQANTATTNASTADSKAVSAGSYANSAFGTANSGASYANSAFTKANNAVPSSGGTITGSLTVTQDTIIQGNLSVLGSTTSINTSSFTVNDSLFILGIGNYVTDALDIGFASHYNAGTNAHTGLVRDSDTKTWTFFEGYTPEISPNNNIIITDPSFAYANVRARNVTGNLIANTVVVNGYDLFTYTTNAYTQANTATTNAATADGKAVTAGSYANSAYTQANTATTNAATADSKAVTSGSYANSAYSQANTATTNAATADSKAVTAGNYANSAYGQANTATTNAATADSKAVTAGNYANSAFGVANSASTYANAAFAQANAAFAQANTGGGGGGTGIKYTASNTTPTGNTVGDQWYYVANDILYEYISDGTSNNWVDITSPTMTSSVTQGLGAAAVVGYSLVFGG